MKIPVTEKACVGAFLKMIVIFFILIGSIASADPAIFGMELGKTTEIEVKGMYDLQSNGLDKYSKGNTYYIRVSDIEFEGLKSVKAIFDKKGTLLQVDAVFPKSKFDYLNELMSEKYTPISKSIPYVGNKHASYSNGDSQIVLYAPHLDFSMFMTYSRDEYIKLIKDTNQAEEMNKKERESTLL